VKIGIGEEPPTVRVTMMDGVDKVLLQRGGIRVAWRKLAKGDGYGIFPKESDVGREEKQKKKREKGER